jgi:hypothetical protein
LTRAFQTPKLIEFAKKPAAISRRGNEVVMVDDNLSAGPGNAAVPYREGSVWSVQLIQSKPGMTRKYLANLRAGWTPLMDRAKEEGLILDYRIMLAPLGSRDDWDVMIMVELENMAALDEYGQKMEALAADRRTNEALPPVGCAQFRDLVGMKLLREVTLG